MEPRVGDTSRQRLAQAVGELRAELARDPAGQSIPAGAISTEVLQRLASIGSGVLGCVLLTAIPEAVENPGQPLSYDPRRTEQMINVAMQLLAPSVRASDLLVRIGGQEIVCLLPGTGPLEARGVGNRLSAALDGRQFWHEDQRLRMRVRAGLSSLASPGVRGTFDGLVEAARRNAIR